MIVLDRVWFTSEMLRWVRQCAAEYAREPDRHWHWSPPALLAAVEALGHEPTPDAVAAAVGEPLAAQTLGECDLCEQRFPRLVRLGEHPRDYDRSTIDVCAGCLRKALALLDTPPPAEAGNNQE